MSDPLLSTSKSHDDTELCWLDERTLCGLLAGQLGLPPWSRELEITLASFLGLLKAPIPEIGDCHPHFPRGYVFRTTRKNVRAWTTSRDFDQFLVFALDYIRRHWDGSPEHKTFWRLLISTLARRERGAL